MKIHSTTRQLKTDIKNKPLQDKYQLALDGYALLYTMLSAKGFPSTEIKITGAISDDRKNIEGFMFDLQNKFKAEINVSILDDYKSKYAMKFDTVFHYEFSEGDLTQIQELLNELRNLIAASEELENDHKQRVLSKLEKLQSELHKKVSDLDRFWGIFIDASIVVGLLGENSKPMVDVIQKIVRIIWPTQTRAYELPSDFPFKLLGQTKDDKNEG